LEKGIEFVVVEVGVRCLFEHKMIGVVRGGELLITKFYEGMRRAGYSPEVCL
jgi:hypothetical protein